MSEKPLLLLLDQGAWREIESQKRVAQILEKDRFAVRLVILWCGVLLVILVAIWFWPVGPLYMPFPPSFDCGKPSLPAEKAICSDPVLGHTDLEFALSYEDNLGAAMIFHDGAIENRLRQSDKDFLAARNRCGSSKPCILQQYAYEETLIEDISGGPRPVVAPIRTYHNHYLGAYFEAWLHAIICRDRQASASSLLVCNVWQGRRE